MKSLFILCICVTVITTLPHRSIYKKNSQTKLQRQSDLNVTTVAPPPPSSTTAEVSAEDAQTEGAVAEDPISNVQPNPTTEENKPIAEPNPAAKPTTAPIPVVPAVVPQQQQVVQNQTKPEEEDDSSSEEEDEADVRQLPTKLEVPKLVKSVKKPRESKPAQLPKLHGVIRGYLSDTGELLVPVSAFPNNFRYSIVDDKVELNAEDNVSASSEETVDNVDDVETQSEEVIPLRVSSTSVVFEPKGPSKNETNTSSVSEEIKPDSGEEGDEKVVSAESPEKPSVESAVKEPPISVFNPPPLAALPATKPTDEDDEEEAGGRGDLPGPVYYINPYHFNPYYYEDYEI